jgi:hypothetical protein
VALPVRTQDLSRGRISSRNHYSVGPALPSFGRAVEGRILPVGGRDPYHGPPSTPAGVRSSSPQTPGRLGVVLSGLPPRSSLLRPPSGSTCPHRFLLHPRSGPRLRWTSTLYGFPFRLEGDVHVVGGRLRPEREILEGLASGQVPS